MRYVDKFVKLGALTGFQVRTNAPIDRRKWSGIVSSLKKLVSSLRREIESTRHIERQLYFDTPGSPDEVRQEAHGALRGCSSSGPDCFESRAR